MTADRDRSVDRAQHNENLYHHLAASGTVFNDWQIVALFYAALHYVKAYALHKNARVPTSHEAAFAWMARESFLKRHVAGDYAELRDRSEDTRYKLVKLPPAASLYTNEYTRIKTAIRRELGVE